jgi:predicted DNA-binding transcriptional regulator YafY
MDSQTRLLAIKRYLEHQTDEEHPATVADILAYLKPLGFEVSRQTVTRELEQLAEEGEDLICNPGKPNRYFIGSRHFELPELKLLANAVTASRFIPQKKAAALIEKLSAFASVHQSGELRRSLYTDKQARPTSDKAYITVDLLHTAERTGRKIICKYFDWKANKKKVYKHKKQDYYFSPYGLIWNSDRYYAVGWSDSHAKIITLRVDRIAVPKLTDLPAVPKPKGFDMGFYASGVIGMYDGQAKDVTLCCENDMMKHIIDRFGEKVKTEILDEGHFAAYVSVPASPTFFSWVFTFGGGIKITAPKDVLASYRKAARTALS